MSPLTVQGPIPPTAANATWPNVLHTRVADVIAQMKAPPWSKRIIADERQLVTLIASPPGGGNRPPLAQRLRRVVGRARGHTAMGADGRDDRARRQGRCRVGAARDRAPHQQRRR